MDQPSREVTDELAVTDDLDDLKERLSGPLGIALGACALGFVAGLLLPATRAEERALGPVRDRIAEQVQSIGERHGE